MLNLLGTPFHVIKGGSYERGKLFINLALRFHKAIRNGRADVQGYLS